MKTASIRITALVGIVALLAAAPAERRLAHVAATKIAEQIPSAAWPTCLQSQGSIEFTGDGHIARYTPPVIDCSR
jgi:hypothetical protein